VVPQLTRLKEAGADVLFMVAERRPLLAGGEVARPAWLERADRVALGPAGGRFSELAGPSGARVHFIQTFSFSGQLSPKADAVLAALKKKYPEIKTLADVTPWPGRHRPTPTTRCTSWRRHRQGGLDRGPKVRQAF